MVSNKEMPTIMLEYFQVNILKPFCFFAESVFGMRMVNKCRVIGGSGFKRSGS